MPRGPLQRHPGLTDHWQRPSETLQLSTVSDTRQLLDTIEGKYLAREKIKIVLNRVSRQNRLHVPDVERTLGHPVAAQIPNDGRTVPASINQGVPFVLSHPGSPVGQCVRHLARGLAGLPTGDLPAGVPGGLGGVRRRLLFGGSTG